MKRTIASKKRGISVILFGATLGFILTLSLGSGPGAWSVVYADPPALEQYILEHKKDPLYQAQHNENYARMLRGEVLMKAPQIHLYADNQFMKKWNTLNKNLVDAIGNHFREKFQKAFFYSLRESGAFFESELNFGFYSDPKSIRLSRSCRNQKQVDAIVHAFQQATRIATRKVSTELKSVTQGVELAESLFEEYPVSKAIRIGWNQESGDYAELLSRKHGDSLEEVEKRNQAPEIFEKELDQVRQRIKTNFETLQALFGEKSEIFQVRRNPLTRVRSKTLSLSIDVIEVFRKFESRSDIDRELLKRFPGIQSGLSILHNLYKEVRALSLSPLVIQRQGLEVSDLEVERGILSADVKKAGSLDLSNTLAAVLEEGDLIRNLRLREGMVTRQITNARIEFESAIDEFVQKLNFNRAKPLRASIRNAGDDFVVTFWEGERAIALNRVQRVRLQEMIARRMGKSSLGVRIAYTEPPRSGEAPTPQIERRKQRPIVQDMAFAGQLENLEKTLVSQLTSRIDREILSRLTIGVGVLRVPDPRQSNPTPNEAPKVTRLHLVLSWSSALPPQAIETIYQEFENLLDARREWIQKVLGLKIPYKGRGETLFEFDTMLPGQSSKVVLNRCLDFEFHRMAN